MSTIFLDPIQMDATAGHIGEHVTQLTTLSADLETACSAVVPANLTGWLAEELHDINVMVRMIALLYTVAALDTAQRAQQIQTDQSLAVAAPSLAATTPAFTEAPLVGGIAPFATSTSATGFLAASAPSFGGGYEGMPAVTFGPPAGFLLGASGPNTPLGGYTPSFAGSSISYGLLDTAGTHENRLWTLSDERSRTTYVSPGTFERRGQVGSWNSLPQPDLE